MDFIPILEAVVPIVLTFIIGLVINKPGYLKAKAVLKTINKALEDDKIDSSEVEEFMDHFRKQTEDGRDDEQ